MLPLPVSTVSRWSAFPCCCSSCHKPGTHSFCDLPTCELPPSPLPDAILVWRESWAPSGTSGEHSPFVWPLLLCSWLKQRRKTGEAMAMAWRTPKIREWQGKRPAPNLCMAVVPYAPVVPPCSSSCSMMQLLLLAPRPDRTQRIECSRQKVPQDTADLWQCPLVQLPPPVPSLPTPFTAGALSAFPQAPIWAQTS